MRSKCFFPNWAHLHETQIIVGCSRWANILQKSYDLSFPKHFDPMFSKYLGGLHEIQTNLNFMLMDVYDTYAMKRFPTLRFQVSSTFKRGLQLFLSYDMFLALILWINEANVYKPERTGKELSFSAHPEFHQLLRVCHRWFYYLPYISLLLSNFPNHRSLHQILRLYWGRSLTQKQVTFQFQFFWN